MGVGVAVGFGVGVTTGGFGGHGLYDGGGGGCGQPGFLEDTGLSTLELDFAGSG